MYRQPTPVVKLARCERGRERDREREREESGQRQKVQNAQMSINIFTINEKLKATKMHGGKKEKDEQGQGQGRGWKPSKTEIPEMRLAIESLSLL